MEKRGVIEPGITPPEQPDPVEHVKKSGVSKGRKEFTKDLADHFSKRAADAVENKLRENEQGS